MINWFSGSGLSFQTRLEFDGYAIVPSSTPLRNLVKTVLATLSFSHADALTATGNLEKAGMSTFCFSASLSVCLSVCRSFSFILSHHFILSWWRPILIHFSKSILNFRFNFLSNFDLVFSEWWVKKRIHFIHLLIH